MKTHCFPGIAVGVIPQGKIVVEKGYDVVGIDAENKVTAKTLFHMASVTKPFVATAIMQLVESGKLDLDSPVVHYLKYFRMKDSRYKEITIRQMLSHVSGMPDVTDYEWDRPVYEDGALERYVRQTLIAVPCYQIREYR